MKRLGAVLVLTVLLGGLVASCSDDTKDAVSSAADSVAGDASDAIQQTGARGIAEAWRVSLKGNTAADTDPAGVRSITVLTQTSQDLPGDPTIVGIADSNGDGVDDDGKVQVNVADESACLTLPEQGNEIDVQGGAC